MKKTGITGITMGCGNVIVLEETLKSFFTICDEVIYGSMLLFGEDKRVLWDYQKKYEHKLKLVDFPFDYIFHNGFASILNELANEANNDLVLYLNTSEIIEKDNGILQTINPDYNCYYFDHGTDPHRWHRFYDKRELKWSGRIHEALEAISGFDFRPYHKPIFRMADLEKDMQSTFKATVFNDVKEIVYFKNYMSLIDNPNELGATDPGWINFAQSNYDSFKERLLFKGKRYEAFMSHNIGMYYQDIYDNPEFEKQRFESNIGIEYQGDKKFLL